MFGSAIIDIAIGIGFVFLLMSLIASTINEIILSFLNMRGKVLLRGLKTLLNDTNATGLVKKLYNHGQIYGLFEGEFNPNKPGNLPAYIPPANFAMALLDVIPAYAAEAAPAPPNVAAPNPPEADAAAMLVSLKAASQRLADNPATEKVGKPLAAMIKVAGGDAAKLQKSLEDWYNSTMDRVSGWYKYRTQQILLVIGLVLAVLLNADTVNIVKQLSKDSTLRQSIVAAAQSAKTPDGAGGQPIDQQIQEAKKQVSQIENLGIPLGWPKGFLEQVTAEMILGWLLTAVAVSLGAPFWFDMLNKIMVVRSTVKPREKSQEEASKEPQKPAPAPVKP